MDGWMDGWMYVCMRRVRPSGATQNAAHGENQMGLKPVWVRLGLRLRLLKGIFKGLYGVSIRVP